MHIILKTNTFTFVVKHKNARIPVPVPKYALLLETVHSCTMLLPVRTPVCFSKLGPSQPQSTVCNALSTSHNPTSNNLNYPFKSCRALIVNIVSYTWKRSLPNHMTTRKQAERVSLTQWGVLGEALNTHGFSRHHGDDGSISRLESLFSDKWIEYYVECPFNVL